jgi:hypothetical protein
MSIRIVPLLGFLILSAQMAQAQKTPAANQANMDALVDGLPTVIP